MSSVALNSGKPRELMIPTAVGNLNAALYPPEGSRRDYTVIFCHGFRGSKEGGGRASSLAARVAGLGFAALLFDFTPLSMLSAQVGELRAVVDYCRHEVGRQVILFGRSMGGSAALAVAAADKFIGGLCLWATPFDLHETFRLSLGDGYNRLLDGEPVSIADEFGELRLSPSFLHDFDRFDLLACATQVSGRPLLVVHGENDEIVPCRQAAVIFGQAGEPKSMAVIPGADHRFLHGHGQASAAVLAWLAASFPVGATDKPSCI
ncbi:alpha/beta hydrolase [Anaeroselena agilis]|uniref:Alpha/beta hydrolase n=1 Tax=Anaeroselena agilis TaxID=3063788 RepID=A0ABU3NVN1_9FIRM|nr:alpha/beta hydrolase [Selenomonadales bacterium 4137-cl]